MGVFRTKGHCPILTRPENVEAVAHLIKISDKLPTTQAVIRHVAELHRKGEILILRGT